MTLAATVFVLAISGAIVSAPFVFSQRASAAEFDTVKPWVVLKPSSDGFISEKILRKADIGLRDNKKIVAYTINGVRVPVSSATTLWGDANDIKVGSRHGIYGKNILTVEDAAGNVSDPFEFYLDNRGPTVQVKTGSVGDEAASIFSNVSFKLSDPYKVDYYTLNGVKRDLTNAPYSDANFENIKGLLREGANELVVYDILGNSTTLQFVFDTTAPEVGINPVEGGTVATPTLSGVVNDPTARVIVLIAGIEYEAVNNGDGTWTYVVTAPLVEGSHEVSVSAKDTAGNVSSSAVTTVIYKAPVKEGEKPVVQEPETIEPITPAVFTEPVRPVPLARVLGDSTVNTATTPSITGSSDVDSNVQGPAETKGASTQRQVAQAVSSDDNKGIFLGLAWYWWILLIAAVALIVWWIIAAIRRRRSEA